MLQLSLIIHLTTAQAVANPGSAAGLIHCPDGALPAMH